MGLTTFINGTLNNGTPVQNNDEYSLSQGMMNLNYLLQAGSITFSKGNTASWGESYTPNQLGRNSSVDTTNSTALWMGTNTYSHTFSSNVSGSDTLHNPSTFTNPTYAFDGNDLTAATKSGSGTPTWSLGTTFAAKIPGMIYINVNSSWGGSVTTTWILETYNGATWTTYATLVSSSGTSVPFKGGVAVTSSVQGVRVTVSISTGAASGNVSIYSISYGGAGAGIVYMNIPAGTFPSTSSSAICVPHISSWETGADIQFKLTNGSGGDTGWLSCGNSPAINTFTAFAVEPATLQIKLIPKVSSPTPGIPAIYGVSVLAK